MESGNEKMPTIVIESALRCSALSVFRCLDKYLAIENCVEMTVIPIFARSPKTQPPPTA